MVALRSRLLARREVAERTFSFEFEKPHGFLFEAGQALEMKLIASKETDPAGSKRAFTIAAAPAWPRLQIVTRLRETAFKRTLRDMPLGGAVELDGPFGSMTLHKNAAKPAVFMAGGIGITPFLSILRQAALERSERSFVLFYSNRRPEDAPFLDELRELQGSLRLKVVVTLTRAKDSARPWDGRRGAITAELIAHTLPELSTAVCYAAGAPGFVVGMKQALLAAGADQDSIRSEDFEGY